MESEGRQWRVDSAERRGKEMMTGIDGSKNYKDLLIEIKERVYKAQYEALKAPSTKSSFRCIGISGE